MNPDQTGIYNGSNSFMNSLVSGAQQNFNMSPQALQAGVNAYTEPMYAANTRAFNQQSGDAINQAASAGGQNSVGFNKYYADNIAQVNAQNQADIAAEGQQQMYNLPTEALQPYMSGMQIATGGQNAINTQTQDNLSPSLTNTTQGNQFTLQNYQNQLAAYNASFMGQLNQASYGIL